MADHVHWAEQLDDGALHHAGPVDEEQWEAWGDPSGWEQQPGLAVGGPIDGELFGVAVFPDGELPDALAFLFSGAAKYAVYRLSDTDDPEHWIYVHDERADFTAEDYEIADEVLDRILNEVGPLVVATS